MALKLFLDNGNELDIRDIPWPVRNDYLRRIYCNTSTLSDAVLDAHGERTRVPGPIVRWQVPMVLHLPIAMSSVLGDVVRVPFIGYAQTLQGAKLAKKCYELWKVRAGKEDGLDPEYPRLAEEEFDVHEITDAEFDELIAQARRFPLVTLGCPESPVIFTSLSPAFKVNQCSEELIIDKLNPTK